VFDNGGMDSHDRVLRQARTAYLAAVRRLDHALRRFDGSGIPMDPGPDFEPRPWTREHVQVIRSVATSFREVIERRRHWDSLRTEYRPPH